MTIPQSHSVTNPKPLRLWPGVIAVVFQWLAWLGLPLVFPESVLYSLIGGVLGGGVAVLVWWLFFSRATWGERIGAVVLIVLGVTAAYYLAHPSIRTGAMGWLMFMFAIPVMCLTLVGWAVVSRRFQTGLRCASMIAAIVCACALFTLVRTDGIYGSGGSDFHWRWTPTHEERLLAAARDEPKAIPADSLHSNSGAVWPGFRGPDRDGVVRGVRITTDWAKSPPVELWRRPIGPAWSSFAVSGDRLYTQEQLGEEEIVSCYFVTSGQPIWKHKDAARFWESNAGAGPRATPTLHNGRIYSLGATGIVNALNADNGSVVWSRNAADDTGAKLPGWGFAGSPLVAGELVIVAASGRLAAYALANGQPRWTVKSGGGGYSSPHLATINGVQQVMLLNTTGAIGVSLEKGEEPWKYERNGDGVVQPAQTADGDILIGSGSGIGADAQVGISRVTVKHSPAGWNAEERWNSPGVKPYFNDFVVHDGHAYGFDNNNLACINLGDGQRKWKGGRYGHGQLILLADQPALLVLSEKGEIALVAATPDRFQEFARVPGIEGKTWNHPVLVGDILLVRNSQQMAAFRVALTNRRP